MRAVGSLPPPPTSLRRACSSPLSMGPTVDRCFFRRAASTVLVAGIVISPALTSGPASAATSAGGHVAAAGRAAAPTNVTLPTLHSETSWMAVGALITADPGTWDTTEGLQFAYQWQLDGADVAGATTDSYRPVLDDLGKSLTVTVTASKDGATSEPATSEPVTVDKGDIHYLTLPAISGDPRPGSVLTLDPGTWDVASATADLEWYDNGELVADGPTYQVQAADVGHEISASVGLEATGYYPSYAFVNALTIEKGVLTNKTAPRVSGTAMVGRTLKVTRGTWSATDGVALTYRWTVGGKPVSGATGTSFKVPASAAGKKVAVVEYAGGPAWQAGSKTSSAVTAKKATSTVTVAPSSPSRGRVKVTVTVKAAVPVTGRVVVTIAHRAHTVTLRSGKATLTVSGLRKGTTRVSVRYNGSTSVATDTGTASVRVK
jgi:hypothetical protein